MIQVHPQRAFLNTPIVISNKGTEPVLVQNKVTGEIMALSPGECKNTNYQAGRYELLARSFSGQSASVVFQVEDAWKFGGSKRKGCYVFEGSPWAIIVMKDRTYFFNEDSGEQFVEHNLSPDNIEELNDKYLLFSTGDDVSLYSLETMMVEETFADVTMVYSGKNHCLFSGDGRLVLYRLYPEAKENRVMTVECDSFIIQPEAESDGCIVRYHQAEESRMIRMIRLLNDEGGHEEEERISFEEEFVCFPGTTSVLTTVRRAGDDAPTSLHCFDLLSGRRVEVYKGDHPISMVNDIEIWEDKDYIRAENEDVEAEAKKVRLDVLERTGFICYVLTTYGIRTSKRTVVNKLSGTTEEYRREKWKTSVFRDETGKEYLSSSSKISFKQEGSLDYVSGDGMDFIIGDRLVTKAEGKLCFTVCGDPYLVRKNNDSDVYFTLGGERIPYVKSNPAPFGGNRSNLSFGLFYEGDGLKKYYWLKTGREYVGNEVKVFSKAPKPAVVSGGLASVGPRFFMRNGEILPVPIPEQDIIALSSGGKAVLYERGGLFGIARYSDRKWTNKENLQLAIYDTLHVKDAVFCSDGESFIYQKQNKLVLFDFKTGEETEFDTDKGIRNNVNGYRPYCTKDYFSRPVIVDPVSRKTIDFNFLSQYLFSSSDGSAFFVKRDIRYYLRDGDKQISNEEYSSLCKEYDYPSNPFGIVKPNEAKSDKRKRYLESVGKRLSSPTMVGMEPLELRVVSFVDYYMVYREEVAIVSRNGSEVEIPIGHPLYYLNYVAFSPDAKRVAIAGKYKDASGLCLIYDMEKGSILHRSTDDAHVGKTMAIWLASFSKNGDVAYYDSTPDTYIFKEGKEPVRIAKRSFLTFSPSGKYFALSKQGYVPYASGDFFWGHIPSCDIYIANIDAPKNCLCHFNDHGSGIVGTEGKRDTVAMASFSADEKRLLSVSNDGVVVVRNLHLA